MARVTRIHSGKQPVRRHFLGELMDERQITVPDLVEGLNDPDRFSELGYIDKSQVYRWLKGQMPQKKAMGRLVEALGLEDAEQLFRDPYDDWLSRLFQRLSAEEKNRARRILEEAFPRRTGTEG